MHKQNSHNIRNLRLRLPRLCSCFRQQQQSVSSLLPFVVGCYSLVRRRRRHCAISPSTLSSFVVLTASIESWPRMRCRRRRNAVFVSRKMFCTRASFVRQRTKKEFQGPSTTRGIAGKSKTEDQYKVQRNPIFHCPPNPTRKFPPIFLSFLLLQILLSKLDLVEKDSNHGRLTFVNHHQQPTLSS